MKIQEFNTDKGIYIFEIDHFESDFHSHPAFEIVIAKTGMFTLWTESGIHEELTCAVISSNQKHKLSASDCTLKIIMIEHHNGKVIENLKSSGIELINGVSVQKAVEKAGHTIDTLISEIEQGRFVSEYDRRIADVIDYLKSNDLEYKSMIKVMQSVTNLSESRLSHLFKLNVGISIKKYLIWTKLKSAVKKHVNSNDDLFSALIDSGFYDQPHFSRSFKTMLGVKPSKAYNSRIIQVLSRPV